MLPKFRHAKDVLSNGLRVVTIELPHLHTAALVMYAKVGSRYETPRDNGLSHFLEHMLFRGTARMPSSFDLNFAIEELGGTLYAETGRDYSLYQISLDPELVPEGMRLFAEIFGAPAFTQLELERKIVLEEINEDLDERGRDINIDDLARNAAFPRHPLGQKITGPRENVRRFDVADVKRHFKSFYGAKNMVFCVAGPLQRRSVLPAAKKHLSGLPSGSAAKAKAPREMANGPHLVYADNPGSQTSVQMLFRALPEKHPSYVPLQALSRILDDGMSTRLHYTLCDQLGLAYFVNASIEPFHDSAVFELDGAAAHGKFGQLVREMLGLVGGLREELVSDKELAKAKRRYRYDLASAFDDAEAMAGWFGGTELFYGPPGFDQKIALMEDVGPKDIQKAAQLVFQPERLVLAATGGLTKKQFQGLERILDTWT